MSLNKNDIIADIVKASPPLTVVSSHLAGVNWSDIAYILTSIYTAIMIIQHVWSKWIKPKLKK